MLTFFKNCTTNKFVEKFAPTNIFVYICATKLFVMQFIEQYNRLYYMNMKKIYQPTESELEILQILWSNGPSTVRLVNEKQNEEKEVGYTTTLKIMQIMADKSILEVDKANKQHVYKPKLEESETKEMLLDGFVKKAYAGSAMKMVLQALGNHKPSKDELHEIKELIKSIEDKSE